MSTESPSNKSQPFYIAAAIAVIVFAVIGSASMLGWLPDSKKEAPATPEAVAVAPSATPPLPAAAPPAATAPAARPAARPAATATPAKAKAPVRQAEKAAPAKVCDNCGVITAIRAIEQPGEATGLGAVAGGVAGALVGSQIGQGRGTTAAEIAGAAGGAYAGHQIEKSYRKTTRYEIDVRMQDGTRRVISQSAPPALNVGDKVRIINGQLELY